MSHGGLGRKPLGDVMKMTVEELHSYADTLSTKASTPLTMSSDALEKTDIDLESAVAWKDKGNQCFQKRDYEQAVYFYSRSIEVDETQTSALANRSMAYLKLGKYQECLEDCTLVLKKDGDHVKSYLRRGTAKQHLGQIQGAVEDFEECIRREPHNSDAIKGRQESIASYLSSPGEGLKYFPEHHIVVCDNHHQQKGDDATGGVTSTTVRAKVIALPPSRVEGKVIRNGIEFERAWRGCRGDADCQSYILTRSIKSPESLPSLLKQCLNPRLLNQIVIIILSRIAPNNPSHAVELLLNLSKTERFSVNCMSLSRTQKKEIGTLWDQFLLPSCGNEEDHSSLRDIYL